MNSVIRVQRKEVDQVQELLNRSVSVNPRVNYQRRNYQEMIAVQTANREKRKATSQVREKPFKLARFARVSPLVFKSRAEVQALRDQRRAASPSSPPLSPLEQVIELHTPTRRNYLRENAKEVIRSPKRELPVTPTEDAKTLNPSYGRIPLYLRKFHHEVAAARIAAAAAAEAQKHPGLRLLSEEERIRTHNAVSAERQATVLALNRVPLGASSPSLLKQKETLERKLESLDKSLELFARAKVFVSV